MATVRGIIDKAADQCVRAILYTGAIKATRYVSPTMTVKATRKLYGKKRKPSQKSIEIILTAGKPNFEERAVIKQMGKAGMPFLSKNIRLKMPK